MGTKLFVVNDEQWDRVLNLLDELREALGDFTSVRIPVQVAGAGTYTPPPDTDDGQGLGSDDGQKAKYIVRRGKDSYADAVWGEMGDKPFTTSKAWDTILPYLDVQGSKPVRSSMVRALQNDFRFKEVSAKGSKTKRFQKRTQDEIAQLSLEDNE